MGFTQLCDFFCGENRAYCMSLALFSCVKIKYLVWRYCPYSKISKSYIYLFINTDLPKYQETDVLCYWVFFFLSIYVSIYEAVFTVRTRGNIMESSPFVEDVDNLVPST